MDHTTDVVVSDSDATPIVTYAWSPPAAPRAVVQIAHGVAEHAMRYDRLAEALTAAGYAVQAHDHRGHGHSIGRGVELGSFGTPGWDGLVADLVQVSASIAAAHPDLPLILIGHSMGSFALQQAIVDHSELYAAVVLSGSTAMDLMVAAMAAGDPDAGLGALNVGFEHRTGYEWLSRDEAEVDAYVADPLSGYDLPPETMPQLFGSATRLADPAALAGIRSDLPMLIASGDCDPLAGGGQLIQTLAQRYRDAGVADVTVRLFAGARHEIFNETNRDEVTRVVIDWMDEHTG